MTESARWWLQEVLIGSLGTSTADLGVSTGRVQARESLSYSSVVMPLSRCVLHKVPNNGCSWFLASLRLNTSQLVVHGNFQDSDFIQIYWNKLKNSWNASLINGQLKKSACKPQSSCLFWLNMISANCSRCFIGLLKVWLLSWRSSSLKRRNLRCGGKQRIT